jgi:hypothetical protein
MSKHLVGFFKIILILSFEKASISNLRQHHAIFPSKYFIFKFYSKFLSLATSKANLPMKNIVIRRERRKSLKIDWCVTEMLSHLIVLKIDFQSWGFSSHSRKRRDEKSNEVSRRDTQRDIINFRCLSRKDYYLSHFNARTHHLICLDFFHSLGFPFMLERNLLHYSR